MRTTWILLAALTAVPFLLTDRSNRARNEAPAAESASTPRAPRRTPGQLRRRAHLQSRLAMRRDEHGNIPHDAILKARKQMAALTTNAGLTAGVAAGLDSTRWTNRGPGNFGGRVRALVISPTQPNTMWTGSVSGGLWRTTNGGQSWSQLNDAMENLAITSIVVKPNNANVMLAGTGEYVDDGNNLRGAGIFRSTDGGRTFARLASTNNPNFYFVNKLSYSADSRTLLAGTLDGIWRSANDGSTWTRVFTGQAAVNTCRDVRFHPTNPNLAVADMTDEDQNQNPLHEALYTTDAGQTWQSATGIGATNSTEPRIEFAWHRGVPNSNVVYAQENDSSRTPTCAIYRSDNGGRTYSRLSTPNVLENQGVYDNTLWVDPSDTDANRNNDVLIAGGIHLWRSTDGARTWSRISDNAVPQSAHPDHHIIVEHPNFNGTTNRIVYIGNDGGIWRADNIDTVQMLTGWTSLNNSLSIAQFYGVARGPDGVLYGGTQDNGTLSLQPSGGVNAWVEAVGGDGGFAAADPTNANFLYGEFDGGEVHRSTDRGQTAFAVSRVNDPSCPFIAPLRLDPNNARRLYLGCSQLWRTVDARATPVAWTSAKAALPNNPAIAAIAVAPGNPDLIYVGYDEIGNGLIQKTTNGTSPNPTWTTANTGLPTRQCSTVRIDPRNTNRVLATFGGFRTDNIWESTNGGTSWRNLSTAPVAIPVRDVAFHPTRSGWLYAATEGGLLVSENNGQSWTATATPANCPIDEVFWSGTTIFLGTHGRGVFEQTSPTATMTSKGASCELNTGQAGGPTLAATPPTVGGRATFSLSSPPTAATLLLGAEANPPVPVLGCPLYVDLRTLLTGGSFTGSTYVLNIPNNPSFVGQEIAFQAAAAVGTRVFVTNAQIARFGY